MRCHVEVEANNKKEEFEIGYVARQASGSVMMKIGGTVMIAAVARDDEPVDGDFTPLTVQYVEKSYAVGKIPGGYIKRETRPGDFETLTSRVVDRSLRPLFPKGYAYPTQITILVVSSDGETDLQTMALNAASVALYISDVPVNKLVYGVRIGKVDGEIVVNPTNSQMQNSSLDLYVSGSKDELLMIEMRAIPTLKTDIAPIASVDPMVDPTLVEETVEVQLSNELSNEETMEVIEVASKAIEEATVAYEKAFVELKKDDADIELKEEKIDESIYAYIAEFYKDDVYDALNNMAKSERAGELKKIVEKIMEDDIAKKEEWDKEVVSKVLSVFKREIVRKMIVNDRKRADGRDLKEVRPITIETNILPRVHGSCLFTRGQTQALVAVTIGSDQDAQMFDLLTTDGPNYEKFMVNYNFPGFSVGEASPLRAPGRRELGHGNLAKRALAPLNDMTYPQVIRVVSEILESNGSSSMATVCGGSLALRAAGVKTKKLVAGIAMGLIFEDDKYAILTDIMGLEDHDGDMDFKVAGTRDGITALQMDIKLGGIESHILKEALDQAKEGRDYILDIMEEADKNIVVNEDLLPSTEIFGVHPSKIVDIIGKAGATIKEIIEKFNVTIDLDREKGEVKVGGTDKTKVKAACDHIKEITSRSGGRDHRRDRKKVEFKKGEEFHGKVKKVVEFGAFVELKDGVDGLLHISKVAKDRNAKMQDILHEGDMIDVVVLSQKGHKVELGLKELNK
ncbi:MAG: polyribonucleotide nucleotidyltransferase [Epsilonproteobacteria bacterium]|nr:polyribonucleotide nucleotidyltransferase [Campylobacterota bacterium]